MSPSFTYSFPTEPCTCGRSSPSPTTALRSAHVQVMKPRVSRTASRSNRGRVLWSLPPLHIVAGGSSPSLRSITICGRHSATLNADAPVAIAEAAWRFPSRCRALQLRPRPVRIDMSWQSQWPKPNPAAPAMHSHRCRRAACIPRVRAGSDR